MKNYALGDRILQCEPITAFWSCKESSRADLHSGTESSQWDLDYSDLFFVQNLPVQTTFWHRILHYQLITAIYSGTDSPAANLRSGKESSSGTQLQRHVLAQISRVRITTQKALCDGDAFAPRRKRRVWQKKKCQKLARVLSCFRGCFFCICSSGKRPVITISEEPAPISVFGCSSSSRRRRRRRRRGFETK